jgi:hypothetical protein
VPAAFNMKGNAWRGIREFIEKVVPGGTAALLAELSPSDRTHYQQDFIPSGWYDAIPVEAVTEAAARLTGMTHAAFCTRFGQVVLERDMNGIYRAILRFATPDMMVKSLPLASRRYFDFVVMNIEQRGARDYVMHLSGIPRPVLPTYVSVTEVFTRNAISGSGGRDVRVETSAPMPGPAKDGIATVTLDRTLKWT